MQTPISSDNLVKHFYLDALPHHNRGRMVDVFQVANTHETMCFVHVEMGKIKIRNRKTFAEQILNSVIRGMSRGTTKAKAYANRNFIAIFAVPGTITDRDAYEESFNSMLNKEIPWLPKFDTGVT